MATDGFHRRLALSARRQRQGGAFAAGALALAVAGVWALGPRHVLAANPAADPTAIHIVLAPELETTLVSQMAGRVDTLNASLGQPVAERALIARMECSEPAARLRIAEAELGEARETLQAKTGLRRLKAAGDMEVALAKAAVEKALGAIDLAKSQIAYCSIKAPFAGRIAKVHVKPFQGVGAGMPLVDLVSSGPLKVRLNVPSTYLRQLSVGTGFEVTINEIGRSYQAKVTAINARVDAVAQSVELEARIEGKAPELLAGMSGTARLEPAP
jgi:RND family efflux transporter MFP subunit